MEFPAPIVMAEPSWWLALPISLPEIGRGLAAVFILLMVLLGSRKIITRLSIEREDIGAPVGTLAGSASGMGDGGQPISIAEGGEAGLDYITSLAEQDPRAVATWITNVTKSS